MDGTAHPAPPAAPAHPGDAAHFTAPGLESLTNGHAQAIAFQGASCPAPPLPDRWPHAMVDIETMSTHSSRAVILSIGVVPFELLESGPRLGPDALLLLPDLAEQLADGRVVDAKTQGWWRDQKPAARAHWLDPDFGARVGDPAVPQRCTLEQAARKLNVFLTAETLPDAGLWANGAVFDIGNLENLLHAAGIQPGWRYNSVRDYRTVSKILPKARRAAQMGDGAFVAHDPVSDCRLQIWRLWEHAPDSLLADGQSASADAPAHAVRPDPATVADLNRRAVQ